MINWSLLYNVIFCIASIFFFIVSINTCLQEFTYNNFGETIGYGFYTFGYFIYPIADYKKNVYLYRISTVLFIIGALIFFILSLIIIKNDPSFNNINTSLGNLSWVIGYIFYMKWEINNKDNIYNLDMIASPLLQHMTVN